jgi:hypothetical protein
MILDEIKNIKESPKDLRKFGLTIGIVLLIIALILIFNSKPSRFFFLSIGLIFILAGLFAPKVLRYLNRSWMTLAIVLGWIMTRVILSVLFYIVITPIGLIARISGKKFLDLKIDKTRASYWEKRNNKSIPADYERQF